MIAIIILGYNNKHYLRDCFKNIQSSTYKKYQIVFVDNNSTDGSIEYTRKYYPDIIVIKNANNYGFAKGNNIGIKYALNKLKAKYVFILNPDTILDKNCLQWLIKKADGQTILQPLILLHQNGKKTNLINTSGSVLHYLGFSYCGDYKKPTSIYKSVKEKEITGASGAAIFVPEKIFRKIGLFDEIFFLYHEDIDLSWRARLAGYSIKLIPAAKIWHKYSFSRNKKKLYFVERNRLMFLIKNFQLKALLLIVPALIISEILLLLYSFLTGWGVLKLKSYWQILINFGKILSSRKSTDRKLDDHLLKKYICPEIEFSEVKIAGLNFYNYISKVYWNIINKLM